MSNTLSSSRKKTQILVGTALFTAIVAVLQFAGAFIRFGTFSISLVLMPIVVGAAMFGVMSGAWLGFVFGVVVLISGDAAPFMAISVWGTVITVLAKGTLCGLASGLAYKLLEKHKYWAVLTASVVCPIVNTGVFLIGCRLFFFETITEGANANGESVLHYMIVGLVGLNFVFELLVNLVLNPIIIRLIDIGKKTRKVGAA